MSKKHYHVIGGLSGGYMPNVNHVCRTKRAAEDDLRRWRDEELDSGGRVFGSIKSGYLGVVEGGNEYYEITECDIGDCLTDEE